MNLPQAISQLQNLLYKLGREVVISHNDQKAFNLIIEFINKEAKLQNPNNIYFERLYAYVLGHLLDKYDTTIDDVIPHNELHAIIKRPFSNIIEDITSKLNMRLKTRILENAGFKDNKHPTAFTDLEISENITCLKTQLQYADNNVILFKDAYIPHKIETGIRNQITTNFGYGI